MERQTLPMAPHLVPKIGMTFDTWEDAQKFYNNYGGDIGFSIRKQYANKSNIDGKVTSVGFVCSKEGFRKKDKRDKETQNPRAHTRCNCKARMGVRLDRKSEKFVIHDFIEEHSHDLHLSETCHMMRSQRSISCAQGHKIDLADDSGINPKATHEYMTRQTGGKESLGYTHLDLKNYLRSKRKRNLMDGEATSLLRYFRQQRMHDPSFYYDIQLDEAEQITNIFWADSKMLIDYSYFGDVITFDTTYSTNKEYRPFGVFVGFNHYRGTIIFGATLLYDEIAESFKWLFETFLEVHKKKMPQTIFADQDHAMAKALSEVMPETHHALCSWYIMQNSLKHLRNLMQTGSSFLKDFNTCMHK